MTGIGHNSDNRTIFRDVSVRLPEDTYRMAQELAELNLLPVECVLTYLIRTGLNRHTDIEVHE